MFKKVVSIVSLLVAVFGYLQVAAKSSVSEVRFPTQDSYQVEEFSSVEILYTYQSSIYGHYCPDGIFGGQAEWCTPKINGVRYVKYVGNPLTWFTSGAVSLVSDQDVQIDFAVSDGSQGSYNSVVYAVFTDSNVAMTCNGVTLVPSAQILSWKDSLYTYCSATGPEKYALVAQSMNGQVVEAYNMMDKTWSLWDGSGTGSLYRRPYQPGPTQTSTKTVTVTPTVTLTPKATATVTVTPSSTPIVNTNEKKIFLPLVIR